MAEGDIVADGMLPAFVVVPVVGEPSLNLTDDLGQFQPAGGGCLDHPGNHGQVGVGVGGLSRRRCLFFFLLGGRDDDSDQGSPRCGWLQGPWPRRGATWAGAWPPGACKAVGQWGEAGLGVRGITSSFRFANAPCTLFPLQILSLPPLTSSFVSPGGLLLLFPVFVYCFKAFFPEIFSLPLKIIALVRAIFPLD